jgi:hypothetical protein
MEVDALARGRRHPFGRYGPTAKLHARERSFRHTKLLRHELKMFRKLTRQLSIFHEPKPRRGAPPKRQQDFAMYLLAEVFVEWDEVSDPLDLPHNRSSDFIKFAHEVLRPFLPKTEASVKALASRWLRYKERNGPSETTLRKIADLQR